MHDNTVRWAGQMRTYFGQKSIRELRLTDKVFTFVNALSVLSGFYDDSNELPASVTGSVTPLGRSGVQISAENRQS
jgi:hypothetical protein